MLLPQLLISRIASLSTSCGGLILLLIDLRERFLRLLILQLKVSRREEWDRLVGSYPNRRVEVVLPSAMSHTPRTSRIRALIISSSVFTVSSVITGTTLPTCSKSRSSSSSEFSGRALDDASPRRVQSFGPMASCSSSAICFASASWRFSCVERSTTISDVVEECRTYLSHLALPLPHRRIDPP